MVTLGIAMLLLEAANKAAWLTGGADGLQGVWIDPLLGRFEFDLMGTTAYAYCLIVTFVLFLVARRWSHRPMACRSGRSGTTRCALPPSAFPSASGWWRSIPSPPSSRVSRAGCSRRPRCLSPRRSGLPPLGGCALGAGAGRVGYLYGGLIGAVVFKLLQDVLSTSPRNTGCSGSASSSSSSS